MSVKAMIFIMLGFSVPFLMIPLLTPDRQQSGAQSAQQPVVPGAPAPGEQTPGAAVDQAQALAAGQVLTAALTEIQACAAQQGTFVGCEGAAPPDVVVESATDTQLWLASGELALSFDSSTGSICRSTLADRTNCSAW